MGKSGNRKEMGGCLGLGGARGKWGVTAKGHKGFFWGDENVLKSIVVEFAQETDYSCFWEGNLTARGQECPCVYIFYYISCVCTEFYITCNVTFPQANK